MDSQIVCSWPSIQQLAFRPQLATPRPVRQSPDRSHTKWSPSSTAYSCRHCRGPPPHNQRGTTTAERHLHRCCTQPSTPAQKTHLPNSHEEGNADSWSWASNLADASATKQPVSAAHLHKHGAALPPHTYGQRTYGWSLVRTSCGCVTHFFLQQARSPTIWQPTTTSMGTPPSLATSSATPPRHPHQPLG